MSKESATMGLACPVLPEVADDVEESEGARLAPVGRCPYCHYDLERREVKLPLRWVAQPFQSSIIPSPMLLEFWGCTNEECRLMFWQHPQTPRRVVFPLTDDSIEH